MAREPSPVEVASVIDQALAKMDNGRWITGRLRWTDRRTKEVSFCSVGAIEEVAKGRDNSPVRHAALKAVAEAATGKDHVSVPEARGHIMGWNDTRKSWDDIKTAFRKARMKVLSGK